jgi:deoxyribose-phosphate aldolase
MNIRQYLDSTYLKRLSKQAYQKDANTIVKECIQEAIDENFKLIMIRPDHVALAKQMIVKSNSGLQIGTVIDFPE